MNKKSNICSVGAFLSTDAAYKMKIICNTIYKKYTLYKGDVFLPENGKFANLDRTQLDRLNALQHEIIDTDGNGVLLVAYNRSCAGCKGCK